MKREQKIRRAHFFRRAKNAAALALFASFAGLPLAHAASFRCPHNASASERIVCSDPALSALDDQLAALYRSAVSTSTDTTALEADRVSQWQWRQHNCKDKACVTDWYQRRIAELEGDLKHGKSATIARVKEGVVEQQLAPSARDAVLEMHGIDTQKKREGAANADVAKPVAKTSASEDAPLHLQKMPSGIAADARQKQLAQAHAHHLGASDTPSAPQPGSALAGKMASATTAFAKAAGMASLDAPVAGSNAESASNAAKEAAQAKKAAPAELKESKQSTQSATDALDGAQQADVALK